VSEQGPQPTVAMTQETRDALPAGTRLRDYEIISVLGHGSFGITYRARDTTLGRDVAIKEYLPTSLALREEGATVVPRSTKVIEEFQWGRDRFVDEARTLAKFDYVAAIVRVHDFLEANGTAYMVMALLEGESLDRRLRRSCLSPTEVERLVRPMLDGLETLHASGFLHRDIKPDNIIIDSRIGPTLIDFGASRAAMAGGTAAMTAIFTPGYAAAEQFSATKQGPWTDIYGLSATLYHAIVGAPPPMAMERMLADTYEPLTRLAPAGFPASLLAAIDAGLKVRAAERPQSIADWRLQFDGQIAPAAGRPAATPPAPAAVASRRRWAPWVVVAGGVALVAAAGAYYLSTTSTPAPPPVAQAAPTAAPPAPPRAAQSPSVPPPAAAISPTQAPTTPPPPGPQAVETALGLTKLDRQHVQVALVALGHGTNILDGVFGSSTRDMIAAWQKARGEKETGFLDAAQQQALLQQASAAVSAYDEEQKKFSEELRKAGNNHPDTVPLADNKRIVLNLSRGTCNQPNSAYIVRTYAKKIDIMFRGGWQTFDANAAGDFSRTYTNAVTRSRLAVKGNLKTRALSVENLGSACVWEGSF
jgi:serine/threonine protein kinase